jgi:probable FeS assembly SUF system protein SufT
MSNNAIRLNRDCPAIQIPWGTTILLPAGTEVVVQQSLGGTYTVITQEGQLVRISDQDADAMGLAPAASPPTTAPESEAAVETAGGGDPAEIEKLVWAQLKTVYDPEIPVNVVDLGLIYACSITPVEEGGSRVEVTMTLTAPGCGMGDVLRADAQRKILGVPGVAQAEVKVVVDPPWDRSRMSEAAMLQLGML